MNAGRDVGRRLCQIEWRDLAAQCHTLFELAQVGFVEARAKIWLANEHDWQQLVIQRLDVSEQPNFLQKLMAHALGFIDDQSGDFAARTPSAQSVVELFQ